MRLLLLLPPVAGIISLIPGGMEPIKLLSGFKSIECSPLKLSNANVSFSAFFLTKIRITRTYKAVLAFNNSKIQKTIFEYESSDNEVNKEYEYVPGKIGDGKIYFTITSTSGSTIDAVTINVKYNSSLNLSIFNSGEYETKSKFACYTPEKGQFEKSEKFTYTGLEKDIKINQKPYIDFSSFRLKYSTEINYLKEFTYEYCNISIYNPDGIFNDVADGYAEGVANFHLLLSKDHSTNEYTFSPVNSWYVNQQTSKMNKYNDGHCVKTNKIHIPSLYFNKVSSWFCTISAHGMGFCLTSINGAFSFDDGESIFGSCENSEYCVKEGKGESDYEIGEVYEH